MMVPESERWKSMKHVWKRCLGVSVSVRVYLVLCPEPVTSVYSRTLCVHPSGSLTPSLKRRLGVSVSVYMYILCFALNL